MTDLPNNLFQKHGVLTTPHAEKESPAGQILARAKVLRYAEALPVSGTAILAPDAFVQTLRADITAQTKVPITPATTHAFEGRTASQLNAFLAALPRTEAPRSVCLRSTDIEVDEPILLRSHTALQGCGTVFHAEHAEIAFLGRNVADFTLVDLTILAPKVCAIMLKECRQGRLENLLISGSRDYGVVLRGRSHSIKIDSCRFRNNIRAGLMIEDGSHHVHVYRCEAAGSKHSSNWAAGIVLSALRPASEYGIRDAFEPNYFYPADLAFKADAVPHQNIVEACHIHHNQSSGLYIDGGNGNVALDNIITDNDKEGLCLDFYAAANLVQGNVIRGNGFRRHQSDDDLRIDMILACGRLDDGSAVAKVPNISLDNAAGNVLIHNVITGGAGGGIKIVRSGFRNIFGLNILADNNSGGNRVFTFPGILLGSAGSEIEGDTSGLDRTGSFENILFSNQISGNHSVGILFDPNSTHNEARRNLVTQQEGPPMVMLAHPNFTSENSFDPVKMSPLRSRLWNYSRILKIMLARLRS
jgi:parallel beta-helix repeat protein